MFADIMLLNLMYSGGLRHGLRESWVAIGHGLALTAIGNFVLTSED